MKKLSVNKETIRNLKLKTSLKTGQNTRVVSGCMPCISQNPGICSEDSC